jgi:hypothetical protein
MYILQIFLNVCHTHELLEQVLCIVTTRYCHLTTQHSHHLCSRVIRSYSRFSTCSPVQVFPVIRCQNCAMCTVVCAFNVACGGCAMRIHRVTIDQDVVSKYFICLNILRTDRQIDMCITNQNRALTYHWMYSLIIKISISVLYFVFYDE